MLIEEKMGREEIIKKCFEDIIKSDGSLSFIDIEKDFKSVGYKLMEDKKLRIGIEESKLKDDYLELRVHQLFEEMSGGKFIIDKNSHDGILHFNTGSKDNPVLKFIFEIKGGKGVAAIEHLRQLDDYVYTFSGEEMARKGDTSERSRGAGWSYGRSVVVPKAYTHPDPHKGVFIMNHEIEKPVKLRGSAFGPNEIDFAVSRNFCLIDFLTLLALYDAFIKSKISNSELFSKIYTTSGVLEL